MFFQRIFGKSVGLITYMESIQLLFSDRVSLLRSVKNGESMSCSILTEGRIIGVVLYGVPLAKPRWNQDWAKRTMMSRGFWAKIVSVGGDWMFGALVVCVRERSGRLDGRGIPSVRG